MTNQAADLDYVQWMKDATLIEDEAVTYDDLIEDQDVAIADRQALLDEYEATC